MPSSGKTTVGRMLAASLGLSFVDSDALIVDRIGTSIADFFVIATANSEPQLRAVSDFIERRARERFGVHTSSNAENCEGGWVLLDFGNVIVHIMTPEMRARYNLEGLWGDADKLRHLRPDNHK